MVARPHVDFLLQAVGPILGGALTTGFNWRAIFWFLAIISSAACLFFLLFFDDTFRQERSLIYQNILKQRLRETRNRSTLGPPDVEALKHSAQASVIDARTEKYSSESSVTQTTVPSPVIKLSLKELNPFKPLALVLRRWNNVVILFASGKQGT